MKDIRISVNNEEYLMLEKKRMLLSERSINSLAKTLVLKERVMPSLGLDMLELAHYATMIISKFEIIVKSDYIQEEKEMELSKLGELLSDVQKVVSKYASNS